MKKYCSLVCLAVATLLMVSCASKGTTLEVKPSRDAPIAYIDLDTFDMSMTRDMQSKNEMVEVRFPNQPVTINDMPERLQKWLSAVHQHGQGVSVETKEGYVQKDLLSLVGVLVSGYKLVKNNMPAILGRNYKAVITLNNRDGELDKVEFIRF